MLPKRFWVVHPFLLGVYAVLAALAHNIAQVEAVNVVRPLVAVLAVAGLLFLLLSRVLRDPLKAGVICSLGLLLFFSYGHVYSYLETQPLWGVSLGRHRLLAPLWIVAMALGSYAVARARDLTSLNAGLNAASLVLLVFPVVQLVASGIQTERASSASQTAGSACEISLPAEGQPPDIYYIILDTYARDDVLREVHLFENEEFLRGLREMGFYVAEGSQSNYSYTEMSIASSLNMDYLPQLGDFSASGQNLEQLEALFKQSRVRRDLECLGYRTVAMETGYAWSQWKDADVYFSRGAGTSLRTHLGSGLTEFEAMLLQTSAGLLVADALKFVPLRDEDIDRYDRMLFVFSSTESSVLVTSPKFVFVHNLGMHPPFVFTADGAFSSGVRVPIPRSKDDAGSKGFLVYNEQLAYVNRRTLENLRLILANSPNPPIILLQGDHGYSLRSPEERMPILNAYYFPDAAYADLYPTISPVNSFRLVFRRYFKGNFEPLPDDSYFSPTPYDFNWTPVPNPLAGSSGS